MEDEDIVLQTDVAHTAVSQVVKVLEERLQRPSRWSGSVELTESLFTSGVAHLDGRIEITYGVWRQPQYRWRTVIHEALHTFSPAYTKHEYSLARGWEEGVVEQMQRLLRSEVLAQMGIVVSADAFAERDARHEYNVYIQALESLRLALAWPDLDFYRRLLAAPLPERLMNIREQGGLLPVSERAAFRHKLLLAQAKLGRV